MSRPVQPGGAGVGQEAAWAVPIIGVVLLLASAATWAGGTLAAIFTGNGGQHRYPPDSAIARFSVLFVIEVARRGTASRWPGVSPVLIWTLTIGLTVLVAAPLTVLTVRWFARRPAADDPRRSLARTRDVAHLTLPQVAAGAARLRPSLARRPTGDIAIGDVGLALAASLADQPIARPAGRSFSVAGKTSSLPTWRPAPARAPHWPFRRCCPHPGR